MSLLQSSEKAGGDKPRPYVFLCRGGIYPALSGAETPRNCSQSGFCKRLRKKPDAFAGIDCYWRYIDE